MRGEESMKVSGKTRVFFSIAAIALCALVFAAALTFAGGKLPTFAIISGQPSAERVVLAVEGMYCDSCAAGIKAMLKRTPGVISADVSYSRKEAVVDYDQQKTTPEKIVEAINNLGYKARVKNKS
jgi:copper chaperone CopZ